MTIDYDNKTFWISSKEKHEMKFLEHIFKSYSELKVISMSTGNDIVQIHLRPERRKQ